jgi:plasmid stabilization system protein ParE
MTYRIEISPTAMADGERIFLWLKAYSVDDAHRWVRGCYEIMLTLEQFPNRCPLAPEARYLDLPIRQLLYKKQYRILFTVAVNEEETETVQIHRVIRASQDRLRDVSQLLG